MPPLEGSSDDRLGASRNRPLEVAFVNNMPDQALAATWEQFSRVLTAAPGQPPLRIRKYVFRGTPRRDKGRLYLAAQAYEPIDTLYTRGADVLVVTGCEPRAISLRDEPYWPEFTRLVDWARYNTVSALWSCLAAHGAVLYMDGIERYRESRKVSGVYTFTTSPDAEPAFEPSAALRIPHSRQNGLTRADLEMQGYRVLTWSEERGVDTFWRREPSLFMFTQGHMEYDAETLAREYRRDVLRFAAGESQTYPALPEGYFSDETALRLDALREATLSSPGTFDAEQLTEILASETRVADWAMLAQRFYRGWLDRAAGDKTSALSALGYRAG